MKNARADLVDSLAFGGGAKNGGISDDAMKILQKIFRFDYMGASQFEHGAVPEAMVMVSKNRKKYTAVHFTATTAEGIQRIVYLICHKDIKEEVIKWIQIKANSEFGDRRYHTFETVGLNKSMNNFDNPTVGWLELDNGFFFFTDEDMFTMTKEAFSIKG
jgi:hypothetical protein